MPANYPFIDVVILDGVRERFAAADAMIILSTDLGEILWTNGAGAALFGHDGIESAVGAESGLSMSARRQISATRGYPAIGRDRAVLVRLTRGVVGFLASAVTMPDGAQAVLLALPSESSGMTGPGDPAKAIDGFADPGSLLAMLGSDGDILAASEGLASLDIEAGALAQFASETHEAPGRLAKRLLPAGGRSLPAGIARLVDDPARYLLLVVNEAVSSEHDEDGTPAPEQALVDEADAPPLQEDEDTAASEAIDSQLPERDDTVTPEDEPSGEVEAEPTSDVPVDVASIEDWASEPPTAAFADLDDAAPTQDISVSDEASAAAELEADEPETVAAVDAVLPSSVSQDPEDLADAAPAAASEIPSPTEEGHEAKAASVPDRNAAPLRFVWKTDTAGRFSAVSPEFATAVGLAIGDLLGRPFRQISERLGFDPAGEIATLLERRDTWSGRSVLWPIAGTTTKVPVDLAALPIYSRDRSFEGFRGFGVARLADSLTDADAATFRPLEPAAEAKAADLPAPANDSKGEAPAEAAPAHADDPFRGETPALKIVPKEERRHSDKVIRLAEHRAGGVDAGLSPGERNAFREIGERLRKTEDQPAAPASPPTKTAPRDGAAAGAEPQAMGASTSDERHADPAASEADGSEDIAQPTEPHIVEELAGAPEPTVGPVTSSPDMPPAFEPDGTTSAAEVASMADASASQETVSIDDRDGETPDTDDDGRDSDSTASGTVMAAQDLEAGRPDFQFAALPSSPGDAPADDSGLVTDAVDAATEDDGGELRFAEPADEDAKSLELPEAGASETVEDREDEDLASREVGEPERNSMFEDGDALANGSIAGAELADANEPAVADEEAQASSDEDDAHSPAAIDMPPEVDASEDDISTQAVEEADDTPPASESARADGTGSASFIPAPAGHPFAEPDLFASAGDASGADSETNEALDAPVPAVARAFDEAAILARLPVPVLIHSGDVLHYANPEFLDLTGYATIEQLTEAGGLGCLFADPYEQPETDADDRSLHLRAADGSEFPIEALLRSVPWDDGHALMLVVRRSGSSKEATDSGREELRAHVAELRTIIDTATDGVIVVGSNGLIRSISRPAEALFGYDSDELTGKPFVSLFAMESQRAARDYLAGLSDHGVASVLNDGREVIGREAQGRFIPLFLSMGKLPNDSGFCAVVRDITPWKRAEEELTQSRSLAERASSQKSEFLARISHEIRTPLNAIIGFSELMIDERFGAIGNDRYRDYLRDINKSGNHVLDLVNDLLDISKIEAGEQEMSYEAVSLNDALAQTVAMMQPQANRDRVIIRSSFASRLPDVVADLRSVRQIALNLLSNAVRYTQAGGQVIVSTAYEPAGDVVIRVRDTGVGMTAAEIEQAMKPFKQINALKGGRNDGTGLGLPLTKAMVEANRARFTLTSTPGEGTLVEVTFPSTRVLAE